ncbi:hypothetical protein CR513_57892, partial [Mucuna pruriens]
MSTPMHSISVLSLDGIDKKVDQISYRGMIDFLLYLIPSRLDIIFNLMSLNTFFRYIKGTSDLSLCYKKYDQYRIKRKSTSGGCHFIRTNIVSLTNERQATQCYYQLLWIKHQLGDYDIFESNIPLLCDNVAIINLSKNSILHSRANHIEIKHLAKPYHKKRGRDGEINTRFYPYSKLFHKRYI